LAKVDLERRALETTGPLKAHWLYLRGAQAYRTGDRAECRQWFQRVVREFPQHPRAEIALFMDARCAFSETRKNQDDESPPDEETISARERATALFERYRKQYPHGRFVADALGWLGALAFDAEKYLDALDCYIAQAETPNHPETLKSHLYVRTFARGGGGQAGRGRRLHADCSASAHRDGIHLSGLERARGG